MYGITWATAEQSICQTGYEFTTIDDAKKAAKLGPNNQSVTVDYFGNQTECPKGKLFGRIESEIDSHGEVEVTTNQ